MIAYAIRRILLMIPTLFAIMVVNFVIIQAAPGGPVQQMIAKLKGNMVSATERVSGGASETAPQASGDSFYRDSQGIPILHDLPGIGPLFGSHNNSAGRTELIMLMTPHVISNDADSRGLTAKIEDQFRTVLDNRTLAQPRTPTR